MMYLSRTYKNMEEKLKYVTDRKLEGERLELYDLFRKKHPGGNHEMQKEMCLQIADERIEVYKEIFSSKK